MVVSVALAAASYYLLEHPIQRLKDARRPRADAGPPQLGERELSPVQH